MLSTPLAGLHENEVNADLAVATALLSAVFQQLADAGVAVYCFDVHGHGESDPKEADRRSWIKNYKHLVGAPVLVPGSSSIANHAPLCLRLAAVVDYKVEGSCHGHEDRRTRGCTLFATANT
jgi:hypothetical protein